MLYLSLSPIFWCLLFICTIFNKKIRENFFYAKATIRHAKSIIANSKKNKKNILFHAASAGEFEQLKPILISIDRTQYFIIVSFTSPTIYNKEHNNALVDIVCYQPFDIIWLSKYFFKSLNPHKYIITRHDIWPNHIMTAANMGINCILINANVHNNSIWKKTILLSLSKTIFNNFDYILVPSFTIKKNIQNIGYEHEIIITGDTRFNQIINRYNQNKDNKILPNSFTNSDNIVFGSIDEKDENVIFPALKQLYPKGDKDLHSNNNKLIFVPHEINKTTMNRLLQKLEQHLFSYSLYSSLSDNTRTCANVLIIDEVGILADLYKYSKVSYIGGGFSRGVHSVIEPAIYNTYIGFGPNIEMLDEAKELLVKNIAHKICDIQDMKFFLNFIYNNLKITEPQKFIFDYKEATTKILKEILQ